MTTFVEFLMFFAVGTAALLAYMKAKSSESILMENRANINALTQNVTIWLQQLTTLSQARGHAISVVDQLGQDSYIKARSEADESARRRADALLETASIKAEKLIDAARILAMAQLLTTERAAEENTQELSRNTEATIENTLAKENSL
jgi:hypothetical protein